MWYFGPPNKPKNFGTLEYGNPAYIITPNMNFLKYSSKNKISRVPNFVPLMNDLIGFLISYLLGCSMVRVAFQFVEYQIADSQFA